MISEDGEDLQAIEHLTVHGILASGILHLDLLIFFPLVSSCLGFLNLNIILHFNDLTLYLISTPTNQSWHFPTK